MAGIIANEVSVEAMQSQAKAVLKSKTERQFQRYLRFVLKEISKASKRGELSLTFPYYVPCYFWWHLTGKIEEPTSEAIKLVKEVLSARGFRVHEQILKTTVYWDVQIR